MTLSQHCRDCLYLGLDFINKRKYHINRIVEGTHVVESLHLSVLCPCVPVFTKDIYVVAKGLRHETRSRSKGSGAAVSQGYEPIESSVPPPLLSRYAEYATAANGGSRSSPSTSRSRSTPRGFGSAARAFVKNIDFAQARIVHSRRIESQGDSTTVPPFVCIEFPRGILLHLWTIFTKKKITTRASQRGVTALQLLRSRVESHIAINL
jgi:hypothetical protein